MRLLVIEDEQKTAAYLKKGLEESGYVVDMAHDGVEGLHLALEGGYDVIVLDVMMPRMDGWSVLKELRTSKTTPVLFLTARDDVEDRVRGFELGGDDYLVKPFAVAEMTARVLSLCRRSGVGRPPVLRFEDVEVREHDAGQPRDADALKQLHRGDLDAELHVQHRHQLHRNQRVEPELRERPVRIELCRRETEHTSDALAKQ